MKFVSKMVAMSALMSLAATAHAACTGSGSGCFTDVPEPGSLSLIGLALAGLVATRFFKKK